MAEQSTPEHLYNTFYLLPIHIPYYIVLNFSLKWKIYYHITIYTRMICHTKHFFLLPKFSFFIYLSLKTSQSSYSHWELTIELRIFITTNGLFHEFHEAKNISRLGWLPSSDTVQMAAGMNTFIKHELTYDTATKQLLCMELDTLYTINM